MTEIATVVRRFQPPGVPDHHRFQSWEHCFRLFQTAPDQPSEDFVDLGALHLAAYMASWGMYRGSGFLLQYAYPVHRQAVRSVLDPAFARLRADELGGQGDDDELIELVVRLAEQVRDAYRPFARENGSRPPSDVLVSKVILGTSGAIPALDRFVRSGIQAEGLRGGAIGRPLLRRLAGFARNNLGALRAEQNRINTERGIRYPLMKVVDMYLWQRGIEGPT